jgi:hypothetical protein
MRYVAWLLFLVADYALTTVAVEWVFGRGFDPTSMLIRIPIVLVLGTIGFNIIWPCQGCVGGKCRIPNETK